MIAVLFYFPSMLLVDWITPSNHLVLATIFISQALLLVPFCYWIVTWKKRAIYRTVAYVTAFFSIFTGASLAIRNMTKSKEKINTLTSEVSHYKIVEALRSLNSVPARFKVVTGKYPEELEELEAPLDCSKPPDCYRFVERLPITNYFILDYKSTQTGYEIRGEPHSSEHSNLPHYFTNEGGLIRWNDQQRADTTSKIIPEDVQGCVTTTR